MAAEPLLGPVTLLGETLKRSDSAQPVDTASALQGKYVALYFSAHWCPPCRAFTPVLRKFYLQHNSKNPKFPLEVVFVSADNSQPEFQDYFREMPWLSIPYEKSELRTALSRKFKVMGIPNLVILDPSGQVVNRNARSALIGDPEGKRFPWPGEEDSGLGGSTVMPIIVLIVLAIAYWLLYPRG